MDGVFHAIGPPGFANDKLHQESNHARESTDDEEERNEMTLASQTHHGIDYIEISITDMAEAQRFYGEAFGWEFTDYGPEYAGIRRGDGEMGGLRVAGEVETGGPLVILYSKDLEATLAAVREAGGRIATEPFDFPGGRRFHFHDSSGNELAVWSER